MNALIGYTGFVGCNLNEQFNFEDRYNSSNIESIQGKAFDLVVCAGVTGTKWLANRLPEQDRLNIDKLKQQLSTIKAERFVHISTVDVYKSPLGVDENTKIDPHDLQTYGFNRHMIEKWVEKTYRNHLIVRLPALFGAGIKKNFIYDLLNPIPNTIVEKKWGELEQLLFPADFNVLNEAFYQDKYGNYSFDHTVSKIIKNAATAIFEKISFTSMVFTDYRSQFQFYYLNNLWDNIKTALDNNLKSLNLAVEPLSAEEVVLKCFDIEFKNQIPNTPILNYDMQSIHYKLFNGAGGYIYNKKQTIEFLNQFIRSYL